MSNVRLYRRMLSYLLAYWPLIIMSVALSFLVVTFESFSLWFGASLVKTLFEPTPAIVARPEFSIAHANDLLKYWTDSLIRRNTPLDSLKLVCLLMAAAFLFKNVFSYVKSLVMSMLNLSVIRDMRNQFFSHALTLPVSYFDRSRSGDIIALIVNDISTINESMTTSFDRLFIEPIRICFFIVLLLVINVQLTLAVFIIMPVLAFVITVIGKTVRRRSRRVLESFSGLLAILHETVAGIRVVKMFNMHDFETAKFKNENRLFKQRNFRTIIVQAVSGPVIEILGVTVVIVLLWYGGREVLQNGRFGAEDFVRFLIFLFSTFAPLKALTDINNTLQRGFAAAERVFSALDSPAEPLAPVTAASIPAFSREISFSHVNFTYPGCGEEVLHDINFMLPKGNIVALVGSSGSGKSTLLDLLPRFYPVTDGVISIDGKDLRAMDLAGLRSLFGIVAQETVLFNESVRANIAYGLSDISTEAVISAAKAAQAWEFIEKMPRGLDTVIGERGVMLSGGQRQRLSIARALLRNPPILILDEATSSLDTESERLVQEAINSLVQNRTVLVVAHRLSTIRHADMILVLDKGSIVERGTHDELLRKNGRYKQLHDIQFAAAE